MPRAPSVTTLPSATVGELRGPGNELAAPVAGWAGYLSDQISLPVVASRQRITSSSSTRAKTYSLPPTSAGVATPSPTVSDHFFVSSLGQVAGALKSVTRASRFGPRHWGQSSAPAVRVKPPKPAAARRNNRTFI